MIVTDTPQVPRLGAAWAEQGGINLGLMRGAPGQPDFYLIAAAAGGLGDIAKVVWSPKYGTTEATSKCDGLANTRVLAELGDDFPAAKWAAGLTLDGFSDWYLGSQRELAMAWATAPEAFEQTWYWSSTQSSRSYAWYQSFDDGDQTSYYKSAQLRARAFRRFIP